ncbi:MAG: hypothetical protein CFE33_20915 [Pseudorhodobacter sp. PARRP1]|nr:MAG: hypothetical protein CFE33_20915 [Pseudorhodobacter sp. PARRP1]
MGAKEAKFSSVWPKDAKIKLLSLARMFLFGAREVWFMVGASIYFQVILSDGTPNGRRLAFFLSGVFMALCRS